MVESLITSLVLTVVIELSFAILFKVRGKEDIAIVILVNIVTNPIIVLIENLLWTINNYTLMMILSLSFWVILEIVVMCVEGFVYKKLKVKSQFGPYKLSIILNSISIAIGIIIVVLRAIWKI